MCDNKLRESIFSVRSFWSALFYMLMGVYMENHISKKIIDVIGAELMPGKPTACLGNGEQGVECCCDECDYYLLCFSEFDSESKSEDKRGATSLTE